MCLMFIPKWFQTGATSSWFAFVWFSFSAEGGALVSDTPELLANVSKAMAFRRCDFINDFVLVFHVFGRMLTELRRFERPLWQSRRIQSLCRLFLNLRTRRTDSIFRAWDVGEDAFQFQGISEGILVVFLADLKKSLFRMARKLIWIFILIWCFLHILFLPGHGILKVHWLTKYIFLNCTLPAYAILSILHASDFYLVFHEVIWICSRINRNRLERTFLTSH